MNISNFSSRRISRLPSALLPFAVLCTGAALAQTPAPGFTFAAPALTPYSSSSEVIAPSAELPNDPSVYLASASADPGPLPQLAPHTATKAGPVAPRYAKYISAGFTAQPLTAQDKFILGVRDLYTPSTFLGEIITAGYSQVLNGQPNYGVDKGAFGQAPRRRGAARYLRRPLY